MFHVLHVPPGAVPADYVVGLQGSLVDIIYPVFTRLGDIADAALVDGFLSQYGKVSETGVPMLHEIQLHWRGDLATYTRLILPHFTEQRVSKLIVDIDRYVRWPR